MSAYTVSHVSCEQYIFYRVSVSTYVASTISMHFFFMRKESIQRVQLTNMAAVASCEKRSMPNKGPCSACTRPQVHSIWVAVNPW